jgi:glycosyltransferase involved in cell wall biosynthesis
MNGPPPDPATAPTAVATGRPLRFAFVTTEFPTVLSGGGGLSSHVARMAGLLTAAGHGVEIFLPVDGPSASRTWNGCLVHHVSSRRSLPGRAVNRLLRLAGFAHLNFHRYLLAQARAVADAVERRHAAAAFDVVQSADHRGIGLALAARPDRLLVVRCSAAMDLYMRCDGRIDRMADIQIAMEQATVARADFAFAPSRLIARHYSAKLGRPVATLRPPVYAEVPAADTPPIGLPPRYLLHFAGQLMPRKGTDLIAAALPQALLQAPDLTMLWVGQLDPAERDRLLAPLGTAAARVICLPRQDKAALYGLIRGAVAAVLPSLIDNLPNTVLESLMLGVPVIGSRDSSIEELVEDGVTGVLIPNGSVPALAEAMVRAWTGRLDLAPAGPDWSATALGRTYRPDVALQSYLQAIAAAGIRTGG